jgi:hypothetical protein
VTAADATGVGLERLRWHVEVRGRTHGLDLLPAAIGKSIAVEVDGRPRGHLPKPTPQQPWREGIFEVDGTDVVVALAWHVPVMRTDVFVAGTSVRDGRTIDAVRRDAPAPLSNYEAWLGEAYRTPFVGSRPRPPRAWPLVVAAAVLVWIVGIAVVPLPPELRLPGGAALAVSGFVLVVAFIWSMLAFAQRVHERLLARPSLGDRRVALWFAALLGYAVAGVAVVTLFVLAAR